MDTSKGNLRYRLVQGFIDLAVISIVFLIFALVYSLVPPTIRYFTCDESDIFFPYKPDIVPFWAVAIFATVGPFLSILIVEALNAKLIPFVTTNKRNLSILERFKIYGVFIFHGISLLALGISLTLLLTEIGKRWIGRLRPHFMDICQPSYSSFNCITESVTGSIYNPIFTGDNFCTTNNKSALIDARLSFPSGHASYSTYCMLFLIIYLEARLHLLKARYIKPLVQLGAFIGAYITAISRIADYHHRASDVIGGAILGGIIALFITMFVGKVLWELRPKGRRNEFFSLSQDDES